MTRIRDGPPGRHIYPHAVVAQFRSVDTRHTCNAECDAPSAFVRCRVKAADGLPIELCGQAVW
jgi:hypothetical protein